MNIGIHYEETNLVKVTTSLIPCDKWGDILSSNEACIEDINISFNSNMLKFNKDQTEFIVFSFKHVTKTESSH